MSLPLCCPRGNATQPTRHPSPCSTESNFSTSQPSLGTSLLNICTSPWPDRAACLCSWPRERVYTGAPYEIGYHQMFEELFEALEERLPRRTLDHYTDAEVPSVPRTKLQMNSNYAAFNPHLRHLSVEYK